ncbi:MAG: type IV pilin N-terminal domain-containing protein [Methanocorpusculum sp.]|nr:type IV pilin N-terminal domain-containing protein [Methanocorpusculum sp.]
MSVKRSDDAVSPVIGIMLMLVVTVVIAAVITGFATGFATETRATPVVMMDVGNVYLPSQNYIHSFDFVHKGGDELALSEIMIVLEENGGSNFGFVHPYSIDNGDNIVVLGKESLGEKATVSTGDTIRIDTSGDFYSYSINGYLGVSFTWTVSEIRTTNILAKGEITIPEDYFS